MRRINKKMMGICLLVCFLLASLGDLRNVIGPLNYWVFWAVVSFFGYFFSEKKNIRYIHIYSFVLLAFGFFISGLWNFDLNTCYQAGKIFICGVFAYCILSMCKSADENNFHFSVKLSVLTTLIIFLCSKYVYVDWFLILGDGRQGFIASYPGVMWKIGAFGFIYFLCMMVFDKKKWSLIYLVLSAVLVAVDGSRTGFLILMMSMLIVFLNTYKKNVLKYSTLTIFLLPLIFFWLIFLEMSSIEILAINRLSAGDSQREVMLATALSLTQDCFPLGCGFGAAVVESNEVEEGVMVIHNGYFDALIDGGFFAFLGFFMLTIGATFLRMGKIYDGLSMFSFLGVMSFSIIMMFHPISTEMSEWAWLIISVGAFYIRRFEKIYV